MLVEVNSANGPIQLRALIKRYGPELDVRHLASAVSRLAGWATKGGLSQEQVGLGSQLIVDYNFKANYQSWGTMRPAHWDLLDAGQARKMAIHMHSREFGCIQGLSCQRPLHQLCSCSRGLASIDSLGDWKQNISSLPRGRLLSTISPHVISAFAFQACHVEPDPCIASSCTQASALVDATRTATLLLHHVVHEGEPLELSRAVYCLYRLRHHDALLLAAIVERSEARLGGFGPEALAGLVAALGGAGHVPPRPWLERACLEAYARCEDM